MFSRLAAVDVVAVNSRRRRGRRRGGGGVVGRRRDGGSVDDVVMSTARWRRCSFRHQIQILQSIINRHAVAVNDLETRRYPSAVSLPE